MSDERREPAPQPPAKAATPASNAEASLERVVKRLEQSRDFMKPNLVAPVLEQARRLMLEPDGVERLYRWAPRIDAAGVFVGTDWSQPQSLLANIVSHTLDEGNRHTVMIECISELRLLAVVNGDAAHAGITPEQAKHFLTQVLALNLDRIFTGGQSEARRLHQGDFSDAIDRLFRFLLDHIGYEDILGSLVEEIWRVLGQRPIQVNHVKAMITQIAVTLGRENANLGDARLGADRLISALFGPTRNTLDDPGLPAYRERLAAMDSKRLQQEAAGFARAMHDVGLVSDYHADFLRWLIENDHRTLVAVALGVSATGLDVLQSYSELVYRLIQEAIYPETAQAVYGLTMLLERGVLYMPSMGPALWRQIALQLTPQTDAMLASVFGPALPPRVVLLAGAIQVLGQPLGVGQGNNPTCQAARAISMWSHSDPDYLLHLIAQAARFDTLQMTFEGTPINSADLSLGLVRTVPMDNDPVSTLLVPHLDLIYHQMGVLCEGRGEDPHYWINPEFHGWWVGRNFTIAVDVETGHLKDYDSFIRRFAASYHPFYNGNQPVIHPQPAGLAVTDSIGLFVGWHAITLQRVTLDQSGEMRVYFYNPNNDSGQDWGHGVIVSTQGNGERFGESSLPFSELASRLYIFHGDPLAEPDLELVPQAEVDKIREMAQATWAAERVVYE